MSSVSHFIPLNIAILTISDTRNLEQDQSGTYLMNMLTECGHKLAERTILPDDRYKIRAQVSQWIASSQIEVILTTGGTGFAERDVTPEAIQPLLEKPVDGFGELFRQLSFDEIDTSTLQSRALAGITNRTGIFCLPGPTNACRMAWTRILKHQLDATHQPCNFVEHLIQPRENYAFV